MSHDWIFDVLSDLRSYALKNGLPRLAVQVEMSLRAAREEIAAAARDAADDEDGFDEGAPPRNRRH